MRFFSLLIFTLSLALFSTGCNKKCADLESTVSGAIVKAYDFGQCFIYTAHDSSRIIDSDTAFQRYKDKNLKACDPSGLEAIDFSRHMLVSYRVKVYACNAAFHRRLDIDTAAKTYTYTVKTELCRGCNTELTSPNWVIMPQLPAGYKLVYRTEEQ